MRAVTLCFRATCYYTTYSVIRMFRVVSYIFHTKFPQCPVGLPVLRCDGDRDFSVETRLPVCRPILFTLGLGTGNRRGGGGSLVSGLCQRFVVTRKPAQKSFHSQVARIVASRHHITSMNHLHQLQKCEGSTSFLRASWRLTRPNSTQLVTMTMPFTFCSQIIVQKSLTVEGRGP